MEDAKGSETTAPVADNPSAENENDNPGTSTPAPIVAKKPIIVGKPVVMEGTPSFRTRKNGGKNKYKSIIESAKKLTKEHYLRVPFEEGTDEKKALAAVKSAIKKYDEKGASRLRADILTNGGVGIIKE